MAKRLICIVVSVAVFLGSLGIHVIEHHCIWCGGDRVEFVAVGLPENPEHSCCDGESTRDCMDSHHCEDENCCLPAFLTLEQALALDEGINLSKNLVKYISFEPAVFTVFTVLPPFLPTNHWTGFSEIPDLIQSRLATGLIPYRC